MISGIRIRGNYPYGKWWRVPNPPNPPDPPIKITNKIKSKQDFLDMIADYHNVSFEIITHGQIGRIAIQTYPEATKPVTELVTWYDIEAAMDMRPPFRLVIMCSCHTGDGKLPLAFCKYDDANSVVLAGRGLVWPHITNPVIDKFIEMVNDPVNAYTPMYELYQRLELGDDDETNDPSFWGSHTMTPSMIYKIPKWEVIKAVRKYISFNAISRAEAVATINLYMARR